MTVLRGGQTRMVRARLAELEPRAAAPAPPGGEGGDGGPVALGVRLAPVTPELARRSGLPANSRGVLIVGMQSGSPAARAGLRPGDLVERVGQTAVTTPQQVQAEVKRILGRQSDDRAVALCTSTGAASAGS